MYPSHSHAVSVNYAERFFFFFFFFSTFPFSCFSLLSVSFPLESLSRFICVVVVGGAGGGGGGGGGVVVVVVIIIIIIIDAVLICLYPSTIIFHYECLGY